MRVVPKVSYLRRRLLKAAVVLPGLLLGPRAVAQGKTTPACGDEPTRFMTAGPFYTPDSPAKQDFRSDDPAGEPMVLSASVVDASCTPLAGAIVDLWHADSRGDYDNKGFRLRGHQACNDLGEVRFNTVRPGRYGWRTPHFHVRIFGSGGKRLLTTQLYFPGEKANARDSLYLPELLVEEVQPGEARFVFVVTA